MRARLRMTSRGDGNSDTHSMLLSGRTHATVNINSFSKVKKSRFAASREMLDLHKTCFSRRVDHL